MAFLRTYLPWVAGALAVVFAVLLLTQGWDLASTWWARRRTTKQLDATEAAHTARAAAEPAKRHDFDSTYYELGGQYREVVRTGQLHQAQYDSLRALFPASGLPVLPARPPRYGPGH